MHVHCFLKTQALELGIKDYVRKISDASPIYFKEHENFEKSKDLWKDDCIILEDFEDVNNKYSQIQDAFGIFLFTDEEILCQQNNYPGFTFLKKPIGISFLIKTLINLIQERQKKAERGKTEKLKIGPFIFEKSKRQLKHFSEAKKILLTEKETELLSFLLNCPEGHSKKSEILENIWNYAPEVSSRTLESHVYALRKKIEQDFRSPQYLLTELGGYRLVYTKE